MPNVLRLRRSNAPEPNRNSEAIYANEDGELKQVAPDGSETDLGASPGGGSQSAVYDAINGLVKDYDPPGGIDACSVLLLDPTAQPWQESHEYNNSGQGGGDNWPGAYVTPTVNPNVVKFVAFENGSAVTASVEPAWSEDGSTLVDDGTVSRPLLWTPVNIYAGAWQATHAFASGHYVIANGYAWYSDGGGNTGGSEPSWPNTPDLNATVSDGAITWTSAGPSASWTAGTRYSFVANADPTTGYSQFNIIPSDAVAGTSYVFIGQPTGQYGTTGATEPAGWEDATSGDGSVWMDGDIMWAESTDEELLVVTGIVAPGSRCVLTIANAATPQADGKITLKDEANVEGDYGAAAVSEEGNRFDAFESNVDVVTRNACIVVYANEQWQPTQPATF